MIQLFIQTCLNSHMTGNLLSGVDGHLRQLKKQLLASKMAALQKEVQWITFLSFCLFFNLSWLPAFSDTVCLYAQFLSESFSSISSVRNYISGVKLLHILTDTSILPFQTTELKLTLKGMARLNPHCPKQASPITPHILLTIHQILDLKNNTHIVFWSLFLLVFFTFARKSNLVAESKLKPSKLYRKHVVIGSKGLLVTFDWTKTIQFNQRCLIIPVVSNPKSALCPTQAYVHMCQVVPASSNSAAFLLPKLDSSPQPLT